MTLWNKLNCLWSNINWCEVKMGGGYYCSWPWLRCSYLYKRKHWRFNCRLLPSLQFFFSFLVVPFGGYQVRPVTQRHNWIWPREMCDGNRIADCCWPSSKWRPIHKYLLCLVQSSPPSLFRMLRTVRVCVCIEPPSGSFDFFFFLYSFLLIFYVFPFRDSCSCFLLKKHRFRPTGKQGGMSVGLNLWFPSLTP